MLMTHFKSRLFARGILGALASLLIFSSAMAQDSDTADEAKPEDGEGRPLERIVVTGSKVVTGADSVSPVVVIGAEKLVEVPRSNLNDFFVSEVTQNIGIITSVENGGQSGRSRGGRGASLNIRGLGEENTLVLVNGARTIEYAAPNNEGWRSVDINGVMPSIAVQRVEMLLDGGGAIYGTDAVAGVVNLIPNYEFRGIKINYGGDFFQGAKSNRDDRLGIMLGGGSERTNIIAAFEGSRLNPPSAVEDSDSNIVFNPVPGSNEFDDLVPNPTAQWLPIQVVQGMGMGMGPPPPPSIGLGAQIADPLCGQFGSLGVAPVFGGVLGDDYIAAGGTLPDQGAGGGGGMGMGMGGGTVATAVADDGCFEYGNASGSQTARNTDNYTGLIALQHEFTDKVRLSLEYSFNDQEVESQTEYARNSTFLGNEDQYFDPDGDGVIANDPDAPGYIVGADHPAVAINSQIWMQQNPGADPADNPWNNPDGYVPLAYALQGFRAYAPSIQKVEAQRFGATLNIDLSENYALQLAGVIASHEVGSARLDRHHNRLNLALRGLGGPGCDPTTGTPGSGNCEYFNPFFSNATAPQLGARNSERIANWIYPQAVQQYDADFASVSASLVGALEQFTLAGGPIAFAVGMDYRMDDLKATFPASFNDGTSQYTGGSDDPFLGDLGNPINNYAGETNAFGALIDINLPLTETFNVQIAGRYEDFDSGNGYSSFDPKVGFNWKVTDALTVRASYNQSFKAPTINHYSFFESLGTTTQSFIASDSPVLLDGDPDNDPDPALWSSVVAEIRVPDADLQPQEAEAVSAGLLWAINDNIDFNLTYTQINFSDVIFALNSGQTLTLCEDPNLRQTIDPDGMPGSGDEYFILVPVNGSAADPLQSSCYGYATGSDETDPLNTDTVFLRFRNLAERNIEAIDFSFRFDFDTAFGRFNISPGGTYTPTFEETDLVTGELVNYAGLKVPGQFGNGPSEWRVNLPVSWAYGDHSASLTGRWISALDDVGAVPGDPVDEDYITVDARYNYYINESMSISAYINNLVNEQPDNTRGVFPVDRRRIGFQFTGTFDSDLFTW